MIATGGRTGRQRQSASPCRGFPELPTLTTWIPLAAEPGVAVRLVHPGENLPADADLISAGRAPSPHAATSKICGTTAGQRIFRPPAPVAPTSWASAGATRCSGDPSPIPDGIEGAPGATEGLGSAQHRNHHHGREATFSNIRSCRDRRIGYYGLRNAYGVRTTGHGHRIALSSICRTDTQTARHHMAGVSAALTSMACSLLTTSVTASSSASITVIRTHSHGIKVWMQRWTVWRTTYNPASTPRKLLR